MERAPGGGISSQWEVSWGGDSPRGSLTWVPSHPGRLLGLTRLCSLSWVLCCGALPSWQDLAVLQDKLRISTKKLEEYETLFKCQEETTQKLVLEYQARLEEGEERLRRQQEDKDIQMKGIISR